MMKTSEAGIKLISKWEGYSATAYMDENDGYTIGYGHLVLPAESYLLNSAITQEKAMQLLAHDVGIAEAAIRGQVSAPLNQNQFDALVSLIYNIGSAQFSSSTVKKRINAYDTNENITEAWQRWNKDDGKVVQGLINRRKAETDLYNSVAEKKNFGQEQ